MKRGRSEGMIVSRMSRGFGGVCWVMVRVERRKVRRDALIVLVRVRAEYRSKTHL